MNNTKTWEKSVICFTILGLFHVPPSWPITVRVSTVRWYNVVQNVVGHSTSVNTSSNLWQLCFEPSCSKYFFPMQNLCWTSHRLLGLTILQVGVIESISGIFTYFVIYAEYGFLPSLTLGIRDTWNNKALNTHFVFTLFPEIIESYYYSKFCTFMSSVIGTTEMIFSTNLHLSFGTVLLLTYARPLFPFSLHLICSPISFSTQ